MGQFEIGRTALATRRRTADEYRRAFTVATTDPGEGAYLSGPARSCVVVARRAANIRTRSLCTNLRAGAGWHGVSARVDRCRACKQGEGKCRGTIGAHGQKLRHDSRRLKAILGGHRSRPSPSRRRSRKGSSAAGPPQKGVSGSSEYLDLQRLRRLEVEIGRFQIRSVFDAPARHYTPKGTVHLSEAAGNA